MDKSDFRRYFIQMIPLTLTIFAVAESRILLVFYCPFIWCNRKNASSLIFFHFDNFEKKSWNWVNLNLACSHHVVKLFETNLTISIDIGFQNHFIKFIISKIHSQLRHDQFQLRARNVAGTVLVKNPKGLLKSIKSGSSEKNSWNRYTCLISSLVIPPSCFFTIRPTNSGKLMLPLPSSSASSTISSISESSGFWPE